MPRFGGVGKNFNHMGALGSSGSSAYTNLGPAFVAGWKTKLDQVRAGTGYAVLGFMGGSTQRGVGVGTGANFDIGADPFAIPKLTTDLMVANGITAIHNATCAGSLGPTGTDSRVTQNGWNHATGFVSIGGIGGGTSYNNATDTTALAFTPTGAFDTIVTWYPRASGRDTVTVDVDGGASLGSIVQGGGTAFLSNTVTCALGTHTVNYKRTAVGGAGNICLTDTYNSAVKSVRVMNLGAASATVSDLVLATNAISPLNALASLALDGVVVSVGGNDCLNGTLEGSYKTDLQTLATTIGAGKLILASHTPVNASGSGGEAARQTVTKWTRDIAVANNATFVDLTAILGTYAYNNSAGYMANANHMNDYHRATNALAPAVIV